MMAFAQNMFWVILYVTNTNCCSDMISFIKIWLNLHNRPGFFSYTTLFVLLYNCSPKKMYIYPKCLCFLSKIQLNFYNKLLYFSKFWYFILHIYYCFVQHINLFVLKMHLSKIWLDLSYICMYLSWILFDLPVV